MDTIDIAPASLDTSAHHWTLLAAGDFRVTGRYTDNESPTSMAQRSLSEPLRKQITQAGIATINLEAPNHTDAVPPLKSGPRLETDHATPYVLRSMGFDHVSLANNHIMDYGAKALEQTQSSCQDAGLAMCGAGQNAYAPYLTEIGGMSIALFSFCEQEFGVISPNKPGVAWIGNPKALDCVTRFAQSHDVVIVMAHGGVENVPFPPPGRQRQLRAFIDAGAAMVIGHHPHVPQGWERYRGGIIFYSLGNFLFDYPDGNRNPNTEWSLLVEAHFVGPTLTQVQLIPVAIDAANQTVDRSATPEDHLNYLHHLSTIQADGPLLARYWQAQAVNLWTQDYWPLLKKGLSLKNGIKHHGQGLMQAIKRRLRGQPPQNIPLMAQGGLLLLNLIRNESHHEVMETALGTIYGDIPDIRTPEIIRELDAILQRTR